MPQRTAPQPATAPGPVVADAVHTPRRRADRAAIRRVVRDRRRALRSELRRPRRRPRVLPLAIAATVAALLIVPPLTALTPLATVRQVRVQGAGSAATAVRDALAAQRGRPLALVGDADVAAALRPVAAVRSFTIVRRPPSTLEVRIVPRTAVVQQRIGGLWQRRDAAGVVLAADAVQDPALPVLTVSGPARPAAYAAAVSALAAVSARHVQVAGVRAAGPDDVELSLPAGRRVVWGGAEDGAVKAEALAAALVHAGRRAQVIDVSSPGIVLTR